MRLGGYELKLEKKTATVQRKPAPGATGPLASQKLLDAIFGRIRSGLPPRSVAHLERIAEAVAEAALTLIKA